MFPKKANILPGQNDRGGEGHTKYAAIIAAALQSELGGTHQAAKTVMRWTGACESEVKHWLQGHHGPGGDYLLALMRESDAVFRAVSNAAGRRELTVAAQALAAYRTLLELVPPIDGAGSAHERFPVGRYGQGWRPARQGSNDPENDRAGGRITTEKTFQAGHELTPRQHWFIGVLGEGLHINARDLQHRWGISEKTARRDLAKLKAMRLIEFIGPFKTGRYRLCR